MLWIYVQAQNQFILGGEVRHRLGLNESIVPEAVGWALIHAADQARVMWALEQLDAQAETVELDNVRVLEAPDLYGSYDLNLVPISCCGAFGDCSAHGAVLGPCRAIALSAREERATRRMPAVLPVPEVLPCAAQPSPEAISSPSATAASEGNPAQRDHDGKELFRRLEAVREIAGEYWKRGRQSGRLHFF